MLYDNHANDIEFFSFDKPKGVEYSLLSTDELIKEISKEETRKEFHQKAYNATWDFQDHKAIKRCYNRIRKMRMIILERNDFYTDEHKGKLTKDVIKKLEASLKQKDKEILEIKEKNKKQVDALIKERDKFINMYRSNKEIERTKRTKLSVSRDKLIYEKFKVLVRQEIGSDRFMELIEASANAIDNP